MHRKLLPIGGADTDLKELLPDLRKAAKTLATECQDIVKAAPIIDGPAGADGKSIGRVVDIDAEKKSRFDKAKEQLVLVMSQIEDIERVQKAMEWGLTPADAEGGTPALDDIIKAHQAQQTLSSKSLGQQFIASEEFQAMLKAGHRNMAAPFEVKGDLFDVGHKDIFSSTPSGTPNRFGTVMRDPLVPQLQRRTRVRDLFPAVRTSAAVIEFFRVTGFGNSASMVPERTSNAFTLKPQSALSFAGAQATVRTIAHWEAAHRNVVADEPQLQALIENELLYGLRLREDQQILYGAGTGEDLLGILNTSGILTYSRPGSPAANENKADDLRRAATLAFLAYYEPTGIVVHPGDWEAIELLKNSQGTYLVAASVAGGAEPRLWRMPVVDTPAITQGTALVGAFGLGAQLYDREESNIRIAEQHSDFFVRNAIVVLAEERLALATKRPESFVKVTLGA